MKEHFVALVYLLLIAGVCFVVMAKPLTARAIAPADFARRRNLWLALTLITFLAHDYWLAMLLSAVAVGVASRREHNTVALYCALLFVVPQFTMPISGLGIINQLFEVDHPRMLAMVLLLPATVRLAVGPAPAQPRLRAMDLMAASLFVYMLAITATASSLTELMRAVVYLLLDYGLLYYVVTRSVTDRRRLFDVVGSFVMAAAIAGAIGVFETARSWLLYESLRTPLGVPMNEIGTYLLRATEDGGTLRAYATMGHAIALGYVSMVAITWHLALTRTYVPKALGVGVVLMLVGGLLASVSRGPWLACAIALVVGMSVGPGAKRRLTWMAASLPVLIPALLLSPQGRKFIDLLPFIGTTEASTVSYRTQLIDRAMVVFWQHPVFGSMDYINNPVLETMRQGQGIIDIVNVYVGIALPYGAVGLLLFVAPSAYALLSCWLVRSRVARTDPDAEALGRALGASLIGVLLVLGSASYYLHVPIVHWLVVALCASYAAQAASWRKTTPATAAQQQPAAGRASRFTHPASRHHA